MQSSCGLLPQEHPVLIAERRVLFFPFSCLEGYLRQTCGCLVDPDDVQQQAVSVLRSLDVQPHLSWCSSFLHGPGWHAALQQRFEPTPALQLKDN